MSEALETVGQGLESKTSADQCRSHHSHVSHEQLDQRDSFCLAVLSGAWRRCDHWHSERGRVVPFERVREEVERSGEA